MAFGTFTLTGHIDVLDGAPAVGPVVIEAIPSVIIDSAGNKLKLGPKNVYLDQVGDFSVSLPTNATTGNSTTIGFRVRTRLKSGLRDLDPVEFYARPIGATVDLSDITTAVVEPIGDTAANRIAAEAAQDAAEAAAAAAEEAAAEATAPTDTAVAGLVGTSGSDTQEAVDARVAAVGVVTDAAVAAKINTSGSASRAAVDGRADLRAAAAIATLLFNVKAFGAAGDGTADDTAEIQAAVNAAVSAGGGYVYFPPGNYKITARIYVNSTGTSTGVQVDGVVLGGVRGAAKITATTVDAALSVGKRAVDSNSQSSGISNGVGVENLEVVGSGIEFWGCQRNSFVRNTRVDLTGATAATRGFYGLFSSTLQLLQFRIDNGGDSIDAMVLDTCSNANINGGSASYSRRGLVVESTQTNSQRTTGLTVQGLHTEGDRRQHYDLRTVGNATIRPHVVTSTDWVAATYPLIHLGSDSSSSAISVRIDGGYINGSGPGGTTGTLIKADYATNCVIDEPRLANAATGIQQTVNSTGLEVRRPRFESVTTWYVNDSGAQPLVLPGTELFPVCSQGGATLSANNTVSLTLGGVNSASATRIPVMRPGYVIGIGLRIGSIPTAGTITVQVQKNGADVTGCQLVKGTGGSGTVSVRFPPGVYAFTTTDDVRVQVATSSDYAVGTAIVPVVVVEYLPG